MSQPFGPSAAPSPSPAPSRGRALVPTLVVLGVLALLFGIFTNVWTERLWFASIDSREVFDISLLVRAALFFLFGALTAGVVALNAVIAYRLRPPFRPMSLEQQSLERYREAVDPIRRQVLLIGAGLLGLLAGTSATGAWATVLQWWYRSPFGTQDAIFGADVGFYVFEYPFWRFLLSFAFGAVVLSLLTAAVVHYLYGGIRLQTATNRVTPQAIAHLSALVAVLMLLKAIAYWLDRYALVLEDTRQFTGASFTDVNAMLPGKTILAIIALVCAVLFVVATVRRDWTLAGLGVGLLLLSAILLTTLWPAVVQQFQVRPSEADREREFIGNNIAATREAYGIDEETVQVEEYAAVTSASAGQLRGDADTVPGVRLLDPAVLPPTFQQLQQVRGFYSFSDPLDVVRYEVDGRSRDMVVAVREIDIAGIPDAQQNWINEHTVYTHGFGYVAAFGNQRNADGSPVWAEEDIPPAGALTDELGPYEPRIYFGENSPPYSIVGAPDGADPVEFDVPSDSGESGGQFNTYSGEGGVPVGSLVNKLLFATRFQEGNILLSNRVNPESKILWDRDPRLRVEKVAPWLRVDGDPYPALIDGRVTWLLDGYTTSNTYPNAQRIPLDIATSDSRTAREGVASQLPEAVNYVRNSVKATVDAYDGTVTLYAWDEEDPVLRVWQQVFPDLVVDRDEISDELLAQFRYPQDLFKIQRGLLARYHVTNPTTFYSGQDFWTVPNDPTVAAPVAVPPYYLTLQMPDQDEAAFSLTTTYVPRNRQNLAAFMAVNADAASEDYGTIRILRLPGTTQIDGPSQVANSFETDQAIAQATLPLRQSGADTREGNLLTLPVGGGLLYVQPLYVERRAGDASFPLLRLVFVSFGGQVGVGSTLIEALDQVFQGDAGTPTTPDGEDGEPGDGEPPGTPEAELAAALAAASQAYADAQAALREGDFAAYGEAIDRLGAALERAAAASGTQGEAPADVPPEDAPAEDAPAEDAPAEDAPAEDAETPATDADAA